MFASRKISIVLPPHARFSFCDLAPSVGRPPEPPQPPGESTRIKSSGSSSSSRRQHLQRQRSTRQQRWRTSCGALARPRCRRAVSAPTAISGCRPSSRGAGPWESGTSGWQRASEWARGRGSRLAEGGSARTRRPPARLPACSPARPSARPRDASKAQSRSASSLSCRQLLADGSRGAGAGACGKCAAAACSTCPRPAEFQPRPTPPIHPPTTHTSSTQTTLYPRPQGVAVRAHCPGHPQERPPLPRRPPEGPQARGGARGAAAAHPGCDGQDAAAHSRLPGGVGGVGRRG
jgi:hypothetical protein